MGNLTDLQTHAAVKSRHRRIFQVLLIIVATSLYGLSRLHILSADFLRIIPASHKYGPKHIWTPCFDGKYDCANITVPKDYFNATAGTASIAAVRYRHTNKDFRGSLFTNPGGPGVSGVATMNFFAGMAGPFMNNHYDIISFDPRGIGATRPRVDCFPSQAAFNLFQASTVLETGFDQPPDPFSEAGREAILNQYRRQLALQEAQYQTCAKAMGDELRYMGTATVVRDIAFMADLLDGPGAPINYFGGSYGTILGAYLVNMFPDRIGKVAIDGVANPVMWAEDAHHTWYAQWMNATEDTHQFFLKECSEAGPSICDLSHRKGEDPKDIDRRLLDFFDKLYHQPIAVSTYPRPAVLTSGMARSLAYLMTNSPQLWRPLATYLADAMKGEPNNLLNFFTHPVVDLPDQPRISGDLSRQAVSCNDMNPHAKDFNATAEILTDAALNVLRNVSPRFALNVDLFEPDGGCQFWPVKSAERFTGPWNHTLSKKILIATNTLDPITPYISAKLLHELLADSSGLLVQNAPGHCTFSVGPSLCTVKAYRDWFVHDILPEPGKVCEMDHPVLHEESEVNTWMSTLDVEDQELLRVWKEFGEGMQQIRYPNPSYTKMSLL